MSLVLKHLAAGRTAAEIVDEFPELELEDIAECESFRSLAQK